MTDVLKMAVERRDKLQEEITKLDDFVVMAESLMRGSGNGTSASATPLASRLAGASPKPSTGTAKPDEPAEAAADEPKAAAAPPKTSVPSKAATVPPKTATMPPKTVSTPATDVPRPNMVRRSISAN